MRLLAVLAALSLLPAGAHALTKEESIELLKKIDQHQKNTGDYKALAYMEQKERDKADIVYEAIIYRRDADEKLGAFEVWHLRLTAKDGVDVAYPVVKLWIDKENHNILKRQEFALSGRLMRTAYYPKWQKLYSDSKKAEVWFPGEMRFFDEVEKSNSTLVLMKSVDLSNLDQNMFTKAWLESKSR